MGVAIVAVVLGMAVTAQAGLKSWVPIASWELNERPAASLLHDGTGHGFTGHIGKRVTPTKRTYHHFPREARDAVKPQHVDVVPDSSGLDPGTADFSVVVRFRWSNNRNDMNFVQKGQGSPAGGMFKVKTSVPGAGQPPGGVKCLFRGSVGDSQVESYPTHAPLNDDQWHQLQCSRTTHGTVMRIDGDVVDINHKQPGLIANSWPVAIGGNTYCNDTMTDQNQCNYFWGAIDYVRLRSR